MRVAGKYKGAKATDSTQVADIFKGLVVWGGTVDQATEHFWIMHLNSRNHIQQVELVALGSLNAVHIQAREVFRRAVIEGSASVIIGHNHPSGNVNPSDDDIQCTRRLHEAGEILGIPLVDHVIITKDSFYSFRREQAGALSQ